MKIIAVVNEKGGVAKTTTALNIAAGISLFFKPQQNVLLIDMDSQSDASASLPIDLNHAGTYELLQKENSLAEVAQEVSPTFHAISSSIGLAKLEPVLTGALDAYRLKDALEGAPYDYVVLDCPPSLGAITTNALVAASHVLVPVKTAYYGLNAVENFLSTFQAIKKRLNEDLSLLGILATQYDARTAMSQDVLEVLRTRYPEDLFSTIIHSNVTLDEAASAQKSIFEFSRRAQGTKDYYAVLIEVLQRVQL